jgi:hypothetical protein
MRAGDVVVLRNPEEILATLDGQACLDGLPFMPEMLAYFGREFAVGVTVRRACDTIHYGGVRRMADTVILEDLRCDGSGHAGCGAQCRLYWKEAWLRPASEAGHGPADGAEALARLKALALLGVTSKDSTDEKPVFRCHATELLRASDPVPKRSARSFVGEVTSGNISARRFAIVSLRVMAESVTSRLRLTTFNAFKPRQLRGTSSPGKRSSETFQVGDLVRIKSREEILDTLGPDGKNRGLWFDREMLPFCGATSTVKSRVERFIDEPTGELIVLRSDCYILDDVACSGDRSVNRSFCPRAIYPWWRAAWLERVD